MGKSENYKVEKKGWHIMFLRLGISLYYFFFFFLFKHFVTQSLGRGKIYIISLC